jgi:hypothetical protein
MSDLSEFPAPNTATHQSYSILDSISTIFTHIEAEGLLNRPETDPQITDAVTKLKAASKFLQKKLLDCTVRTTTLHEQTSSRSPTFERRFVHLPSENKTKAHSKWSTGIPPLILTAVTVIPVLWDFENECLRMVTLKQLRAPAETPQLGECLCSPRTAVFPIAHSPRSPCWQDRREPLG